MFKYCPSCCSTKIRYERDKVFRCPDCGFTFYNNTAAATACIIACGPPADRRLLFQVRNKDPGKGKLDLAGGFVDNGEGAVEGLLRELREELGWTPPAAPRFFASFPNVYPYKGFVYNTCDLFFVVEAPALRREDLRLEETEVASVRFVKPADLKPEDIAFPSARAAVKLWLEQHQPT